jgi:hypothetical protein
MIDLLGAMRLSHLSLLAIVVRDLESQEHAGDRRRTGVFIKLDEGADLDLMERDWGDMVGWDVFKGNVRPLEGVSIGAPLRRVGREAHLRVSMTSFGEEFAAFVGAANAGPPSPDTNAGTNRGAQPRTPGLE